MKLADKKLSKSNREETGKAEIEKLEEEIPKLSGVKREEQMKAYRRLLSSSAEEPVYFMRS